MTATVATTGGRSPVAALTGATRTFPGSPPVQAVRAIDLTVEAGDYVAISGRSGSGKSTLLHLLGLLDRPTSGSYRLDGHDTTNLSDAERTALRGHRVGFVFQAFHLLPHRTALDNVVLGLLYRPGPGRRGERGRRNERSERARESLAQVGLGHRVDALPTTLSGGERQRVAIARAVVTEPALLLADEPTGNLDSGTAESVLDTFDALHERGFTVVVITHDDLVARRASRQLTMRDGVLTEEERRGLRR